MYNSGEIKNLHKRIVDNIKSAATDILIQFGEKVKENVSSTTLFGGTKLKNSTRAEMISDDNIRVSIPGKIAVIMEEGSDAHIIKARRKQFLYFQGNNGPIFTKSVKHPGTKATKFFEKATTSAAEIIEANMDQKIELIFKQ